MTTEYALRVLTLMAKTPEERLSVRHLHETLDIPQKYLGSVMSKLAQRGLLLASRGKMGGYELARPQEQITLLEVVNACEGLETYSRCLLGLNECSPERPCALHERLVTKRADIRAVLTDTTLSDLAKSPGSRLQD
jgi:Rrf2 family transcriptional regulator, iron-sulfur cluster assembly transcription factor